MPNSCVGIFGVILFVIFHFFRVHPLTFAAKLENDSILIELSIIYHFIFLLLSILTLYIWCTQAQRVLLQAVATAGATNNVSALRTASFALIECFGTAFPCRTTAALVQAQVGLCNPFITLWGLCDMASYFIGSC